MNIVFMGTPEFAAPSLKRLLDDGYRVVGVFTQPDKPVGRQATLVASAVKKIALENNLKVLQPAALKNNEAAYRELKALEPDVLVVVAYGQILSKAILEIPRLGAVNVHASLLPKYRGAAPIHWAIVKGETETGITTMKMDEGLDTGDILLQQRVPIAPDDDAETVQEKLSRIGASLLSQTLVEMTYGDLRPVPQDPAQATYAPLLKKSDGSIHWSWTAMEVHNRRRGLCPWPGTYCRFRGKTLKILRTNLSETGTPSIKTGDVEQTGSMRAGGIYVDAQKNLFVLCGDLNWLRLEEVQLEGHRPMAARDFVNGMRLKTGDRLE